MTLATENAAAGLGSQSKMADGTGHAEVPVALRSHIEMSDAQDGDLEMPREGPW